MSSKKTPQRKVGMSFTLDPKARELLDACTQQLSDLRFTSVTVSGFLNEYLMRTLPGELERLKKVSGADSSS